MAIKDPTKSWAVVLLSLEGSAPPQAVPEDFAYLFGVDSVNFPLQRVPPINMLNTYWHDVTQGAVKFGGSRVFGWYPSGWSVLGTAGMTPFPGVSGKAGRRVIVEQARQTLLAHEPKLELDQFRGILAVTNFSCDGGATGPNVAYGLAVGSDVPWAESDWHFCDLCHGLIASAGAALPCTNGAQHSLDMSNSWMVPTDPALLGAQQGFSRCTSCGVLYDATSPTACPSGGPHQPQGTAFGLMSGWTGAIGETEWHRCSRCSMVLRGKADTYNNLVCPAGPGPHVQALGDYSVLVRSFTYNRTFLAHEMGHAYGFIHGRNTDPHSTDLADDCYPGGYGDRFDIMSAFNCDYYTPAAADSDARFGAAGPTLSAHHLVDQALIPDSAVHTTSAGDTPAGEVVTIRPVDSPGVDGFAVMRAENFMVELRMRTRPNGTSSWDRNLDFAGATAAVVVYDVSGPSPVRVLSTTGRSFLVAGDVFETRIGLGTMRMFVASIDINARQAVVSVDFPRLTSNSWQRWIILPAAYRDVPGIPRTHDQLGELLVNGAEKFWDDMSGGEARIHAGWVLSARGNVTDQVTDADKWLPVGPATADAGRSAADRVTATLETVLNLPGFNGKEPLYLDWRWFTGIIVIRNSPGGAGYVGRIPLRSGNATSYLPNCSVTTERGDSAGALFYDVVELGADQLTAWQLNQGIAASMGLTTSDKDQHHLMSTRGDALRYTAPDEKGIIKASWGPVGPATSANDMAERGWLAGKDMTPALPQGQESTAGTIRLLPLLNGRSTSGYLRAQLGPWTLECRVRESWDSGLPEEASVIALQRGQASEPIGLGEGRQWGPPVPVMFDSGSFTVTELSTSGATIEYQMQRGKVLVAGGGVLHGGESVLFGTDGRIHRIPPGDPWEKPFNEIISNQFRPALKDMLKRTHDGQIGEPPIQ